MTRFAAGRPRFLPAALGLAAACAALAAACKEGTGANQCFNDRFDTFRADGTRLLAFALMPKTISYHSLDVRRDTIEQTWDTIPKYWGGACLRFQSSDSVRIDSAGVFQFFMSGDNVGTIWQRTVARDQVWNDSLGGQIFTGCDGDGGRFRLRPDSTILLDWGNGVQARIFDAAAVHKLAGDTLWSTLAVRAYGDSARATWRAGWIRAYCGEGL